MTKRKNIFWIICMLPITVALSGCGANAANAVDPPLATEAPSTLNAANQNTDSTVSSTDEDTAVENTPAKDAGTEDMPLASTTSENTASEATGLESESTTAAVSETADSMEPKLTAADKHFPESGVITEDDTFATSFRRGINIGNMLEAPREGAWGVYYKPEFISLIKEKGFDFIRLPVSWGYHFVGADKSENGPYIDEKFLQKVVGIVDDALLNGLGVVLNFHHYDEMNEDPEANAENYYEIWRIISAEFKDYPANLVFEVLNEPHGELSTKRWIPYQNECIRIIREEHPDRKIVVTGGDWGGYSGAMDLVLPDDPNLILSFHNYDPFNFTHQGTAWVDNMNIHLGMEWLGTDSEKRNIELIFINMKALSEATGIPILLGEFGAYEKADMESRVRWTSFMRETAEKYGFAWSYWEFCSGFAIYDQRTGEFKEALTDALVGTPMEEVAYNTGKAPFTVTFPKENQMIGPFKTAREITIICDSWTGMMLYDTDNKTQIIELGDQVAEWAQAYIILEGLTDTGDGFSKDICELTIRNIDQSITDFCINLDNTGSTETEVAWLAEEALTGNTGEVRQNEDGTTTITLDLQKAYPALKGKCADGVRIKMFIESVPHRSDNYDGKGMLEFISVKLS